MPATEMNIASLTSLAMLKVNIDQRSGDYLEYLVPFTLAALSDLHDEIADTVVTERLKGLFGLRIPVAGVHLVLQRLAKRGVLKRSHGLYSVAHPIPSDALSNRRDLARSETEHVVEELKGFALTQYKREWTDATATDALLNFLSKFAIECLRTYAFRTALPKVGKSPRSDLFVVGAFITDAAKNNQGLLAEIMVLVKGQMLANALVCPDLESLEKAFRTTTFFLDTPLILDLFGLQGAQEFAAQSDLVQLLRRLGAKLAVFSHTTEELHGVLEYSIRSLEDPKARTRLISEMRRSGKTRSDLVLIREKVDRMIADLGLREVRTPEYIEALQISEKDLVEALEDEVRYFNPRAIEHDINSVRSIYVLRGGKAPVRLEDAPAVFVTSNSAFARAAYIYGRRHETSREVSPVIAAHSLANVAWLKAPLGAPDLPRRELLATCYAVMSPSDAHWTRFLAEIDRLRNQGRITAEDHQLLRSAVQTEDELMDLTLGEDELLRPATVTQIIDRVKAELVSEKDQELAVSRKQLAVVEGKFSDLLKYKDKAEERAYWFADKIGRMMATVALAIVAAVLVGAVLASPAATSRFLRDSYTLTALANGLVLGAGMIGAWTWLFDLSVKRCYERVRAAIRTRALPFAKRILLPSETK